jgi:hypothetical protein
VVADALLVCVWDGHFADFTTFLLKNAGILYCIVFPPCFVVEITGFLYFRRPFVSIM